MLLIPLMVGWGIYRISPGILVALLAELGWLRLLVLFSVNVGIFVLMVIRWQLVLQMQGYAIPLGFLLGCRLAGFGLNYFTPGPPVMGDPFQIYLLNRLQLIPLEEVIAATAFDRLIELICNVSVLTLGLLGILLYGSAGGVSVKGFWLALFLLILPVGYLGLLFKGYFPLSTLLNSFPEGGERGVRVRSLVQGTESRLVEFCRSSPWRVGITLAFSGVVWVAMGVEYWLALFFWGIYLDWGHTFGALILTRSIFMLPFSPGWGTLELGQLMAIDWLGKLATVGLGLSFWMRLRDSLLGMGGLIWSQLVLRWRE